MTTSTAGFTPQEQRLLNERPLTSFEQGLDLRQVAYMREQAYLYQQGRISEQQAAQESLNALSSAEQQALITDGRLDLVAAVNQGVPDLVLRGVGLPQEAIEQGKLAAIEQQTYEAGVLPPIPDEPIQIAAEPSTMAVAPPLALQVALDTTLPVLSVPVAVVAPSGGIVAPTTISAEHVNALQGQLGQAQQAILRGAPELVYERIREFWSEFNQDVDGLRQKYEGSADFYPRAIRSAEQNIADARRNPRLTPEQVVSNVATYQARIDSLRIDQAENRQAMADFDRYVTQIRAQINETIRDTIAGIPPVVPAVDTNRANVLAKLAPYQSEGGYDLAQAISDKAVTVSEAATIFDPLEVVRVTTPQDGAFDAQRRVAADIQVGQVDIQAQNVALVELQRQGLITEVNGEFSADISRVLSTGQADLLVQAGFNKADIDAAQEELVKRQEAAIELRALGLAESDSSFFIPSSVTSNVRGLFLQVGIPEFNLDEAINRQRQLEQSGRKLAQVIDVKYELGQDLVALAQARLPKARLADSGGIPTSQVFMTPYPSEFDVQYVTPEGIAQAAREQQARDQELFGLRGALREIDEGVRGPEARFQIEYRVNQLTAAQQQFDNKVYEISQKVLDNLREIPPDLLEEMGLTSGAVGVGVLPKSTIGKGGLVGIGLATATLVTAEVLKHNPELLKSVAYEQVPRDLRTPPGIPLSQPASRQVPGFPRTQIEASIPGFIRLRPPEFDSAEPGRVEPPTLPGTDLRVPTEVSRVLQLSLETARAENAFTEQVSKARGLTEGQRRTINEVITPGSVIRDFDIPDLDPNIIAELEKILANAPAQQAEAIRRRLRTVNGKRQLLAEATQSLVVSQGFAPQQPQALQRSVTAALLQPQPVVIFEEARRTQTRGLPDTRRQTQTSPSTITKPDIKPDVREITELTPAVSTGVQTGVNVRARTAPLTGALPGVRTAPFTADLPLVRPAVRTRPAIRTRTMTRTVTRTAARTITKTIAIPRPAIRVPRLGGGLPLPSQEPTPRQKLLIGDYPQRVAFNTGATDLEVNLPSGDKTWHSDLSEVPEISAEESFTVLERGYRRVPVREFPMGKAHVTISGSGVKFRGRRVKKQRKIAYESPGG